MKGLGFRVLGEGFRVLGLGCRFRILVMLCVSVYISICVCLFLGIVVYGLECRLFSVI